MEGSGEDRDKRVEGDFKSVRRSGKKTKEKLHRKWMEKIKNEMELKK